MNSFERLVESFERCGLSHGAAETAAAGRGVSVAEARRKAAALDGAESGTTAPPASSFDGRVDRFEAIGLSRTAAEVAAAGRGRTVAEARRQELETSVAGMTFAESQKTPELQQAQRDLMRRELEEARAAKGQPIKISEARTDALGRPISPVTGRPYSGWEVMAMRYGR